MNRVGIRLPAKRRCAGPCRELLPLADFDLDNSNLRDGRQSYCPRCKASATKAARWLKQYGLTVARAERCMELQGNLCPICHRHISFAEAHVHHDHQEQEPYGEVKGLLHGRCNTSDGAGVRASRWARLNDDPPMRRAGDGVPLIAPCSGADGSYVQPELPI